MCLCVRACVGIFMCFFLCDLYVCIEREKGIVSTREIVSSNVGYKEKKCWIQRECKNSEKVRKTI